MTVDPAKFEHAYRQLLTITYQKDPDHEPSFTKGFWNDQEGYKRDFWVEARKKLELDAWDNLSSDEIISRATQPFGVLMSGSYQKQNLVSDSNYMRLFEIFQTNPKESIATLHDVFFGDNDEAAFNRLAKLLSRRSMNDPLSIASLFFFLKNPKKYVTARKQGTGDRLSRLDLNASCVQNCSWSGYQKYLEIISDLHSLLLPYHPDSTFLDAQSFLWMLWMVQRDTPEYEEKAIDPFETTVTTAASASTMTTESTSFTEGKKVEVYTTKYERDPRVRRQFLAAQSKPYRCEVCGMDFEAVYGALGKDVIEVHHKKPLFINGVEQEVKPTAEYLACLCANCHRMIHKKQDSFMTVEELKKIVDERKGEKYDH